MKLSVIMTTYNSPEWLAKVLWGYSVQRHKDFEIIIGDDGSTEATRELIDTLRQETGLRIKHVWQPDQGFRKCRILNQSILEADAEYIVFTDGDCIPRPDFLTVHANEARPGRYLSGGYHKLPPRTSAAIAKPDIISGQCFDLAWLKANGLPSSYKNAKLTAGPVTARLYNALTPTKCNFKGSNGSAWRSDIMATNGFDERMAWGGLDREFGVRLANYGVKPKHVRYNAIVLHLHHERGYSDPQTVAANKAMRQRTESHKIVRTDHGISRPDDAQENTEK
jgi:glycosyltransferase involved in cell wall biosynthesis